jgi:hypothetical protein
VAAVGAGVAGCGEGFPAVAAGPAVADGRGAAAVTAAATAAAIPAMAGIRIAAARVRPGTAPCAAIIARATVAAPTADATRAAIAAGTGYRVRPIAAIATVAAVGAGVGYQGVGHNQSAAATAYRPEDERQQGGARQLGGQAWRSEPPAHAAGPAGPGTARPPRLSAPRLGHREPW